MLLHEGLGSVGLWRGFPEQCHQATGRRVIAYSRFGHGRSARAATKRTPAFFGSEALDVLPVVLEQLDAPEPVLVGHSDGASIALVHAASHPVAGAVLMAPHVVVEPHVVAEIERIRAVFSTGGLRERMARHHDDPDVTFSSWADMWLDGRFAQSWSLEPEAARLTAPTLLLQGVDDQYGTLEQLDRIAAVALGPTERVELACGHSPHLEAPELTLAAIERFAAGLP